MSHELLEILIKRFNRDEDAQHIINLWWEGNITEDITKITKLPQSKVEAKIKEIKEEAFQIRSRIREAGL